MEHSADVELIARVAAGDENAFLDLHNRTARRVYSLALRIVRDPMLAEEVAQDSFVKLWRAARLYRAERGTVQTWLLTIARHTALDRLRLEARRALSQTDVSEASWQEIPDSRTTCEESRWWTIWFAVCALPPRYTQVLELAYYQGLSHREIAETLGWPLGTVKTRLHAALQHLRREWSKQL